MNKEARMNPQMGGLDSQSIPAFDSPDLLWDWVNEHLRDSCGIDGIFYLCYPVGDSGGTPETLIHRAIWKTSYPEEYLAALPGNPLTNDYSANHVLETGEVSRWHDPESPAKMTPGELKRIEMDERYNMTVGSCFPIFTRSRRICGGFGLRSGSQNPVEYDAMLQARHDDLAKFLIAFDERFRGPYARSVFKLSPQEVRVLAYLAGGMAVARLSHEMGLSAKTVEAYMASARKKTNSSTTAEAVAKSIFFNLV
jgi:DNA-binding CsgD family transcriptional regulator